MAIDGDTNTIYWINLANYTISYASLNSNTGGTLSTTGATINVPGGTGDRSAAGKLYWGNYSNGESLDLLRQARRQRRRDLRHHRGHQQRGLVPIAAESSPGDRPRP